MGCHNSKEKPGTEKKQLPPNQAINRNNIRYMNKYQLSSVVLGAGSSGKVFLAHNTVYPDFQVAIKTISKRSIGNQLSTIKDEIKIL